MIYAITGDLGLFGEREAVVLGFISLGLFLAMALSCRSFPALAARLKIGRLTESKPYRVFFRYHSFYWYGFFLVLILHIGTGLMHTSLPQAGDPDEGIHWAILIFAGSVLLSLGLVFSSCRSCVSLMSLLGRNPLAGGYKIYYRLHSYLWVLLLLALVGHLTASYIHIGFWPTKIE
jgi:hypothetical protein